MTVHYIPGGDRTLESAYDRFGNRKSLVFTDGSDVMDHTWTYSKLNRLVEAELASPNPLEFTYRANDDLETITHGNGVETEYTYFPEGPVASITVASPSEQLLQLSYTVNKVLNITGITEKHAASGPSHAYAYGYDALDRLTSATYPTALGLPASEAFGYDAVGNREDPSSASVYDYDANNRITASPGKAWAYDSDGNPVSTNLGLGTEETYAHDDENRTRGYTSAATSASAAYLYDPFARRMKKSVNGTVNWFLWDGDRLLAEFDGSGDRERRYTYTGGYAPAEQAVVTGSTEAVQQLHADHLDTPRSLSSSSATAVWRAAYRAFGTTTPNEDPDGDLSDVALAVRFPGQFADAESALHYNRFRTYLPVVGRYGQADPLGQGASADVGRPGQQFAYGSSNPLSNIDLLGLWVINRTRGVIYILSEGGYVFPLPPGWTYDDDVDGIAVPCLRPGIVFKTATGNDAEVLGSGEILTHPRSIEARVGQMALGDWKGRNWLNDKNRRIWDPLFEAAGRGGELESADCCNVATPDGDDREWRFNWGSSK